MFLSFWVWLITFPDIFILEWYTVYWYNICMYIFTLLNWHSIIFYLSFYSFLILSLYDKCCYCDEWPYCWADLFSHTHLIKLKLKWTICCLHASAEAVEAAERAGALGCVSLCESVRPDHQGSLLLQQSTGQPAHGWLPQGSPPPPHTHSLFPITLDLSAYLCFLRTLHSTSLVCISIPLHLSTSKFNRALLACKINIYIAKAAL